MRLVRLSAHTVPLSLPHPLCFTFLITFYRLPFSFLSPVYPSPPPSHQSFPIHILSIASVHSLLSLATPSSLLPAFIISLSLLPFFNFSSHSSSPLFPPPLLFILSEATEWAAQGKSVEAAGLSPNGLICGALRADSLLPTVPNNGCLSAQPQQIKTCLCGFLSFFAIPAIFLKIFS